ncbi:MAG TPA: Ig-like domain-containing protein [Frankiaceae bacterium]|jgi:hypothetical protein|nr:Ig-like domain-containing protein [Frankiaceae bacterium]
MNLCRGGAAIAAALALVAPAASAMADEQVTLTGTYRRMAVERPTGHVYDDLLVTNGRSYRLRLTGTQHPRPGDTVRVSASATDVASGSELRTTGVTTLSGAKPMAVTGATSTLAILAYWTAPDATTQAKAQSQLFNDDTNFVRENSYAQTSLGGVVTPWVRISPPTDGRCYDYASQILSRARTAATALGYRVDAYDRTLVYFPRCNGSDTANLTGWAYEPGDSIWLNGVMDRRTSVHEHGHSFGMGHARSYACTSGGVRVTLGGTCATAEYGDPFDAMGQSGYVGHYSAKHKEDVGWLGGRKRILTTSSATFTLPPYERSSSSPVVAVVNSPDPDRHYWLEYRQPVGFDANLPAGATAGLLVHLDDQRVGPGPYLLDLSPGDGTFASAVLGAGRSWTAPDGVRFAVGSVSSTGATVTVSGARPEPVPPTAPRLVAAQQGDQRVRVTWQPPVDDGNGTILRYQLRTSTGATQPVVPGDLDAVFSGLTNDTPYTFWVSAVNEAGEGPEASATATPRLSRPTVAVTSPEPGSTVHGDVQVRATALPGADSLGSVRSVAWSVDGDGVRSTLQPDQPFPWPTLSLSNGAHTVTATVTDDNGRTASHTATYDVRNFKPAAAITSPAAGAAVTGGVYTITADVTPPDDGVPVQRVEFFQIPYWTYWPSLVYVDYTAPYEAPWDLSNSSDTPYTVFARAYDEAGRIGVSPSVQVTVVHARPTVAITSPGTSSVRGTYVTVTADAATGTPGVPLSRVGFSFGGQYLEDSTAPYSATFDTSNRTGSQTVSAVVYETSGRSASTSRQVTLDNPLPVVALTSPRWYESVRTKSLTVTGTARPASGSTTPVGRVEVTWGGRVANVVPAADGTWSATFDVTGVYGGYYVTAKAVDTAGYWQSDWRQFTLVRPTPAVTLSVPAAAAVVSTTTPLDLVATVVHPADAVTTVDKVCFRASYVQLGCGERQEDGTYRLAGAVLANPGYTDVRAVVRESDGQLTESAALWLGVMGPPPQPPYAVAYALETAAVELDWGTPYWDPYQPTRGYVVRDEAGAVLATTTGTSATFTPRVVGQSLRYTVEAVNDYGTSGRTWSDYVTPQWTTMLVDGSVTRTSVTYLDYVTIRARLVRVDGTPVAGAFVDLDGRTPTGYASGSRHGLVTSSTGWVSVTFRPDATADYAFNFWGDGARRGAGIELARIVVANRVTGTLTRTAMTLGTTTWLNGRVDPATRGRTIYLQRYVNGAWHTAAYRGQNIDGTVAFAIKPTARGSYTYRLYYGGDGWRSAGASPARTVTVS